MYDPDFNGLVFEAEEGDRLAQLMGDKRCVICNNLHDAKTPTPLIPVRRRVLLHSNHGPMVVGKSVAEAMEHLYYLERAAEVQIKAMSTGLPLCIISDEVAKKFQAQMIGSGTTLSGECEGGSSAAHWAKLYFAAVKRGLKRSSSDCDFDQ